MDITQGYTIETPYTVSDAYKIRKQCLKYDTFFVKLEGGDPKKFHPVSMEQGGDGIYTYVFDQDKRLHTGKVSNQFELGTIHRALAYEGNVKRVLASGELRKTGNRVEFNLLSGTFMLPWMTDTLAGKYDKEVQVQTRQLFETVGLEAEYTDKPFITEELVPVTKEQLDAYVDAGFQVKLFKDRKLCLKDTNMLKSKIIAWKDMSAQVYAQDIREAEEELRKAESAAELYTKSGGRRTRRFKMPRRMSRKYCKKTPCKKMGFTQRASCRPWKNCYKNKK